MVRHFNRLGFILAFLYALKICKRYQVNQDHLIDCIIAGLILGIIGARLYYVIFYPGDMYWKDPIKILYINEGAWEFTAASSADCWAA